MAKRPILPPVSDSQKREVTVNLRFSADIHERLKTVADFSNLPVASLLFYVTVNTTLPMMQREMQKAQRDHSPENEPIRPSDTSRASILVDTQPIPPLPPDVDRLE